MKKKSQGEIVLEHLQSGQTLTGLEAIDKYHIYRLSSVIERLRKAGYNIETIDMQSENSRYGKYRLVG